ncbi:MAG: DUF3105 domain-containing protein [Anaerolineales bacterium]|nr:DUF3105 domain-containing protein [Anaerolineales bacterium]
MMNHISLRKRIGLVFMVVFAFSAWACASAVPAPTENIPSSIPDTPVPTPSPPEANASTMLGEDIPLASREHIQEGMAANDWTSDPPTSGQHYGTWAPAGFYPDVIADEYLVHDMEHGYVIIYYNCALVEDCDAFKTEIEAAMADAGNDPDTHTVKIIAVPRENMNNPITYASWGHLYKAETFVPEELVSYVHFYRSNSTYAPEWNLP